MWKKIAKEYRRQFNIIVFVVLPVIFILALIGATKTVQFIGFTVDLEGIVFVSLGFVIVYIWFVFGVYRDFQIKRPKQQTTNTDSEGS